MTKLPPPEQWVLCKMSEIEVAEMIEKYIDFYVEYENGYRRSVHLPMQFVRHFMRRHDGALPAVTAYATAPIVLADGNLLAPEGLDRERGIQFVIQDGLRAAIPQPEACTPEAVKKAMAFLCNEWLVDVATDYTGRATIVAAALTLIERSLLPDRPCFFVTAGRRGNGKTTTIIMLIVAVTGGRPAAAAWSTNEEERRKALMSYFIYGAPYILWDNIPRVMQISCPHIEKSCTSAYYSDRRLGVSEMVCTAASTIHFFTGNNIGARALSVRQVLGDVVPAFERLRQQGKTRFLGFTAIGDTAALHQVIDARAFDSAQVVYNMLNPSAAAGLPANYPAQDYGRLFDHTRAAGVGVVGIRVLAGGALSGSPDRHPIASPPPEPIGTAMSYDADVVRAGRLMPLVKEGFAATLTEAATRFALSHPAMGTILVGMATPRQFEDALAAVQKGPLPSAALDRLTALRQTFAGEPR